ncbi:hypothetical protein ALC56_14652, partial [Trachymyrmex septentrionalis]
IENFLGNKKVDNYKKIVAVMILTFYAMKVTMLTCYSKYTFFYNHWIFFPSNLGEFRIWMNSNLDEHNEYFYQDIAIIEKRFKGKDIRDMPGEYCWSIVRDTKPESYKRQIK